MRNLFSSIIAVAGLMIVAAPVAAQAQGPTRVGYIDTRRVIQEAPGAQDARTTLEREMATWQREMQAMEDTMQTMRVDFQQRSLVMSAEARQRREQEIEQKRESFQARAESLQQRAVQRQQELMEPIMTRVEEVIGQVRQAEGFAIVFDVASEAIVSADPSLDLTARVIERLRAAGPAAASR
jgi:outer membrane protein